MHARLPEVTQGWRFLMQASAGMSEGQVSDGSGSHNPGRGVRFSDNEVDKDLSIHPSAHNENNLETAPSGRTADKYYKDMQSIHGDQASSHAQYSAFVRPEHVLVLLCMAPSPSCPQPLRCVRCAGRKAEGRHRAAVLRQCGRPPAMPAHCAAVEAEGGQPGPSVDLHC
jgi:hypothetical protein